MLEAVVGARRQCPRRPELGGGRAPVAPVALVAPVATGCDAIQPRAGYWARAGEVVPQCAQQPARGVRVWITTLQLFVKV